MPSAAVPHLRMNIRLLRPVRQVKYRLSITVNFDPANSRRKWITTNGDPATIKVRIKGNVLPKPLKGRDVTFIGGIRFSDGLIRLDTVARGEPVQYILHFQNAAPYPIRILKLDHPVDVQAYYPPFTVLTGEKMRVTMTFIPSDKRPYGAIRDSLVFKTNDREKPEKVIYLEAFISRKNRMKQGIGLFCYSKKILSI